jgi:hypothetical protein
VVHADDAFGRAAADVHDQAQPVVLRQRMRRPHVDQPRFLPAGDDLDRIAQRLARLLKEGRAVAGDPNRVGGHRSNAVPVESAEPLGESPERLQRPLLRRGRQFPMMVQTRTQPDVFLDLVEKPHLLPGGRFVHLDDQEPEAVGSEIDGRQLTPHVG